MKLGVIFMYKQKSLVDMQDNRKHFDSTGRNNIDLATIYKVRMTISSLKEKHGSSPEFMDGNWKYSTAP